MVNGWKQCQLGDVLTLQRGFDITKKEQKQGSVPVISSSGINSFHNTAKVNGPGVIIGRKGSLGTVFYIEEDYWPHDTTLWVKDFHGNFPRFAYYFLSTLSLAQFDTGASNPTLNRNHVHLLPVYWPPLSTQRKIASILSAYDDLIENNTRRIAILEEMAQSLYREWFVHFRFPGHEKKRLVESELGLIPEGWEVKAFSEIAQLQRNGIDPNKHEQDRFEHYSIPAFDAGCMPIMEFGGEIKSNKFLVPEGAILLSKINPRIPRVWLPIFISSRPAIASTEFLVLLSKSTCTREFLFSCCQSSEFIDNFTSRAGGTSTSHQRVKPEDLMNLIIALPERGLLKTFTEVVAPMNLNMHNLRLRNANLRQTRDLLLPKLISGEVDVEGLDIHIEGGTYESRRDPISSFS
jgi:type I restriction enzyme, S subunit